MTTNYDPKSTRPRLAHLSRRLGGWDGKWLMLAALVALGAGTSLLIAGLHAGWSVIGLGILVCLIETWYHWYLRELPVTDKSSIGGSFVLQDRLDIQMLMRLKDHSQLQTLWQAAAATWQGIFVLNHAGLPGESIEPLLAGVPADEAFWEVVSNQAKATSAGSIHGGLIVGAMLMHQPQLKSALSSVQLDTNDIAQLVEWVSRLDSAITAHGKRRNLGGIGRDWAAGYTPTLNQYGYNVSHQMEDYGFGRYVPPSRQKSVDQIVQQLSGGSRTGVVLLGPPGIGKTTIVQILADQLIHAETTPSLKYHQIVMLSAATIVAGSHSLEDTLLTLFYEAVHAGNMIIFLDEAQVFFESGVGSVDIAQILLPILQQSNLKLIMAMSNNDWQRLTTARSTLTSLSTPVTLREPSQAESIDVLQDSSIELEHKTKTVITYQAIREAYQLANRYLPDEALPGKAQKLLEDASHYAEAGLLVTAHSVQQVVENLTGTKLGAAGVQEKDQLLNLEAAIHKQMVNQSRAVGVVANALRRARSGVANPKRPVGSFLFLGPTGVGKTELAKAVANSYFGGVKHIVRLDMSEYQQPGDVKQLLAATPEGTGSNLVSAIRRQPFSLVLLDEVEKAHPDVLNVLLQLLDEGQVTDSSGRAVSFRDCIIVATSNAAADDIRKRVAAGENLEDFETEIVNQIIESHQFRQELLNRFDEIVLFRPLTKPELLQVVDLLLVEVNGTLAAQKISVELTNEAKQWLVDSGYDPRFGARPMRRAVQRAVENTVAKRILDGSVVSGQTVKLDVADIKS